MRDLPPVAKWLVRFGSIILSAAALTLLGYVGFKALWEPHVFSFVWLAIVLILVAFVVFLIATIISALKIGGEAQWRFAGYQLVAFFILVLSLLAFAMHHREGERSQTRVPQQSRSDLDNTNLGESRKEQDSVQPPSALDTTRNVAEMAAIMVLFLLAELAAFIAHDVTQAKTMLEQLGQTANTAADKTQDAAGTINTNLERLEETTSRIKQLRLLGTIAALHSDVIEDTVNLVSAWGHRVPTPQLIKHRTDDGTQEYRIGDLCWRILLREYLKQELLDVAPDKIDQGIPRAVMPRGRDLQDVSFIATDVGFYAKFLSSLVDGLSAEAKTKEGQKLCMAIITNMLPSHCWDWPMADAAGGWRSYEPIDAYRKSMLKAVRNGAQIDRVLLVYDDPTDKIDDSTDVRFFEAVDQVYWRRTLLKQMWEEWYILLPSAGEDGDVKCSTEFATERGEMGEKALPLFPAPIHCAATQKSGSVYPIIVNNSNGLTFKNKNQKQWKGKKLSEQYNELHGEHGICWELPLNKASLDVFEGRHDMMFIGLGKGSDEDEGLWHDGVGNHLERETDVTRKEASCDWGICLMSSMNMTTETMFLTVISGRSVQAHYDWCSTLLNNEFSWIDNRLNKKTATPPVNANR